MFSNPLTGTIHQSYEDYLDSLADSYREIKVKKYNLDNDELLIVRAIDGAIRFDGSKPSVTAVGKNFRLRIARKELVNYFKERKQLHPLYKLARIYTWFEDYISITVKEKGKKIENLIKDVESGKFDAGSEQYLVVRTIKDIRSVKSGKPAITISELKSGEQPEEGFDEYEDDGDESFMEGAA